MNFSFVLFKAFELFFNEDEDELEMSSREKIYKNKSYAEDVVPRFSSGTFKQHFRVSREVFGVLCNDLHKIWIHEVGVGRRPIELDKKMMIALWYLGNQESMRSIGDRFGVCIASVWRCTTFMSDMLIKLNRQKRYIRWPTPEENSQIARCYAEKYRFKGIVGCIDGSHIPVWAPIISPNSYINRKGYHFVLLQGVCDHNLLFTYCYTGEAGSIHDALLLRRSGLINKIESGHFNMDAEQHLLGDSAYSLKSWLITPFKDCGHLTEEQKIFNIVHSKCRVSIERAFGLLKGRFRRLFGIDSLQPKAIVKYIMASCILHNICLRSDDVAEDFIIVNDRQDVEYDFEVSSETQTAQSKRDNILNSLF